MSKLADLSKFRKGITKGISGISTGFFDPKIWVSTGNYGLNKLISNDFYKGVPLGKVTIFAGESGSGKSYIVSGNLVKNAQEMGMFVVLVDTENALDETWLRALGVDTSEDKLLKVNMSMINDLSVMLNNFIRDYKELAEADRPQVLFVVDSLGMLTTTIAQDQAERGDLKGDMGHKPKQLKALILNVLNQLGPLNIGLVCSNHSYASQDMYSPDAIISGGSGPIFASSIVVATKKLNLKEDSDGNKVKDVLGIRCGCKIVKSRFSKPFETMEIRIPFNEGMDAYSGLFDFFEKKNIIIKDGNKYIYKSINGTEHKLWKKEYNRNENGILDLMMEEYDQHNKDVVVDSSDIDE